MSFTENPRSALCSAGVCCGTCGVEAELEAYAPGTCGVEAELEAYAPLVRSVARRYAGRFPSHPPPPSPNGAQKRKPERRNTAPAFVCRFFAVFVFSP